MWSTALCTLGVTKPNFCNCLSFRQQTSGIQGVFRVKRFFFKLTITFTLCVRAYCWT
jgi:hypothetical protein